jgi:methionyl-tRNA formyltransferase
VSAAGFAGELRGFEPDLGVVVAFGQFLPKRVRELPSLGYLINGHASLLPRFRGAAPIAHAILAGESETGVSVMRLAREMDAGPVAAMRSIEIGPDETARSASGSPGSPPS